MLTLTTKKPGSLKFL